MDFLEQINPNKGYVNRFKVGCDPEFSFYQPGGGPVHARNIGLEIGECLGSDLSGRQAEFRVVPSRSALKVVASLYATMQYAAYRYPALRKFNWRVGAYNSDGDGLGGHIHFGRKYAKFAGNELRALDALTGTLAGFGVLHTMENAQRSLRTAYGRFGDRRAQPYGYEYRTMSCWLDSPRHAFLVLTLAKLAVYNPALVLKAAHQADFFKVIFEAYANRDYDAELALQMLQTHGLPISTDATIQDCKAEWGIIEGAPLTYGNRNPLSFLRSSGFPSAIEPTLFDVQQVQRAISLGRAGLEAHIGGVFETPDCIYYESAARKASSCTHNPELADFLRDLVIPRGVPFLIARHVTGFSPSSPQITLTPALNGWLKLEELRLLSGLASVKVMHSERDLRLSLAESVTRNPGVAANVRRALLGCGLPLIQRDKATREFAMRCIRKYYRLRRNGGPDLLLNLGGIE